MVQGYGRMRAGIAPIGGDQGSGARCSVIGTSVEVLVDIAGNCASSSGTHVVITWGDIDVI